MCVRVCTWVHNAYGDKKTTLTFISGIMLSALFVEKDTSIILELSVWIVLPSQSPSW